MFFLTNKGKGLIFSFLMVLLAVGAASAQTFNGPGFTISDGGGRVTASCSLVPVTGITSNVLLRSVSLNSVSHTWIGDLEARIYPPAAAAPPSITNSFVLMSPPDSRGCNLSGTYRFIDSAAQSIDAASTGCTSAQNIAAGDYRTSTYGGGTANGPLTSLSTSVGSLTPAQANGNWRVCVFDFATPDGGAVGSTTLDFAVVTAAQASINGRVTSLEGRGITGAKVILTDSAGNSRSVVTNSFGMYSFDEVAVGETYVVTVAHKRYQFQNPTQVLSVSESISGLNFVSTGE